MLGRLAEGRRGIRREGRGLQHWVVHDAAIGRGIWGKRADSIVGAIAPDLFKLSGGDIRTIVSGDGSPELVAARLVDGAETVSVNHFALVSDLSVDTKAIVGLGRSTRSQSARLGEENLVLGAAGRGGDGSRPDVGAAGIADGRAVAGGLRVGVVIHRHSISRGLAG